VFGLSNNAGLEDFQGKAMFQNLNLWQRRWLMASGVIFVLSAIWTAWKYPSASVFLDEWSKTSQRDIQNYSNAEKEITDHCTKTSEHRDPAVFNARYKVCWEKNQKFYEVAVRSKNERSKELRAEFDRQVNVVLPKRQMSTLLRGFSIWFFSSLLLYGAGMLVVWRRNAFSLKWLER
jgi:hypothetical protein